MKMALRFETFLHDRIDKVHRYASEACFLCSEIVIARVTKGDLACSAPEERAEKGEKKKKKLPHRERSSMRAERYKRVSSSLLLNPQRPYFNCFSSNFSTSPRSLVHARTFCRRSRENRVFQFNSASDQTENRACCSFHRRCCNLKMDINLFRHIVTHVYVSVITFTDKRIFTREFLNNQNKNLSTCN